MLIILEAALCLLSLFIIFRNVDRETRAVVQLALGGLFVTSLALVASMWLDMQQIMITTEALTALQLGFIVLLLLADASRRAFYAQKTAAKDKKKSTDFSIFKRALLTLKQQWGLK